MVVWKSQVSGNATTMLLVPRGTELLTVQYQNKTPTLWYLVDPDEPKKSTARITSVGTGRAFEMHSADKYISTIQDDYFVWHFFGCVIP